MIGVGVPPEGLPLARARNAGARRALDAGAELLVFLDVDCIPGAALLQRYEAAAAGGPALLCGPVAYLPPAPRAGYPTADLHALASPHPARPVPPEDESPARRRSRAVLDAVLRRHAPPRGACSAGSARTTSATAARTPTSARSPRRAGVELAWVGGAWAYHQHHATAVPPVQPPRPTSSRNAALFHRRWGWWPMRGWLTAFAERGLARHDPAADRWVLAATE